MRLVIFFECRDEMNFSFVLSIQFHFLRLTAVRFEVVSLASPLPTVRCIFLFERKRRLYVIKSNLKPGVKSLLQIPDFIGKIAIAFLT